LTVAGKDLRFMPDQEFEQQTENIAGPPGEAQGSSVSLPAAEDSAGRESAEQEKAEPGSAEPGSAQPGSAEPGTEQQASAGQAEAAASPAPPAEGRPGMDWFIIHTYSGFENKVAESLRARASAYGFADRLGQVLIPTEEVVELRNGKKVTSKRLLYPGYVMVQMAMDDELWHHIKNTPRVTGFVGGGNTPVPLSAEEVGNVFNRQASSAERPRPKLSFEKNETVRIIDGPFTSFQGKVDEVNNERNTLRVLVTIFGRATPVELEFLQVEKTS
jgi:transcriptional antiterminator NusG